LGYIADRPTPPGQIGVLLIVVPLTAMIVFALNLPGIIREVRHVRVDKPLRVAEEDAELSAAKQPPQPIRRSPWD
jgi:hypothetical protein